MPEFTITRQINAPLETVWTVLKDFGGHPAMEPRRHQVGIDVTGSGQRRINPAL